MPPKRTRRQRVPLTPKRAKILSRLAEPANRDFLPSLSTCRKEQGALVLALDGDPPSPCFRAPTRGSLQGVPSLARRGGDGAAGRCRDGDGASRVEGGGLGLSGLPFAQGREGRGWCLSWMQFMFEAAWAFHVYASDKTFMFGPPHAVHDRHPVLGSTQRDTSALEMAARGGALSGQPVLCSWRAAPSTSLPARRPCSINEEHPGVRGILLRSPLSTAGWDWETPSCTSRSDPG